jgi:hypothetical protein
MDGFTGYQRKLHCKKLYTLYSPINNIGRKKLRRISETRHLALIGEVINECIFSSEDL